MAPMSLPDGCGGIATTYWERQLQFEYGWLSVLLTPP